MSWTPPAQASTFEMQIRSTVASLAVSLSKQPGLRIVNAQLLSEISPLAGRFDVKSELVTGLPYSLSHASAIGEILASLVHCRAPKKGMITDLDNTLWAGILGDDGADGISWNLERQTHVHGLYQQFVSSLAGAGVLIAVASKNDPADVDRAFNRKDLLISRNEIFPFEIHWRRKSESVQHILNIWNVSADSVVFVDDSPMEVAEVQAAFPEMECIVFPNNNNQAAWDLLRHLRDVFGKSFLTEDDSLRLESIRGADSWRDVADSRSTPADDFLEAAEASIVFERVRRSGDLRSLELINKTNQFNLNGKRFGESEWLQVIADPTSFLLTVSYKDKYGPLGKIAVIRGSVIGRTLHVHIWVMSCRAFSRRIEHRCLKYLFDNFGADEIVFEYKETSRNGPLQDFFAELTGKAPVPGVRLSKDSFLVNTPPLFHHVEDAIDV
jgi:FkbH-like protein